MDGCVVESRESTLGAVVALPLAETSTSNPALNGSMGLRTLLESGCSWRVDARCVPAANSNAEVLRLPPGYHAEILRQWNTRPQAASVGAASLHFLPVPAKPTSALLVTSGVGELTNDVSPDEPSVRVDELVWLDGIWRLQPESPRSRCIGSVTDILRSEPTTGAATTCSGAGSRVVAPVNAPTALATASTPWGTCLASTTGAPAWLTEIDPFSPPAVPVQRTSFGQLAHTTLTSALTRDGRFVCYFTNRGEQRHLWKFVCTRRWDTRSQHNKQQLLEDGVLSVARFEPDGRGVWLDLARHLDTPSAEVPLAIQTAQALKVAHLNSATRLEQPIWMAAYPATRELLCTSIAATGDGAGSQAGRARILRWRELGSDAQNTSFVWDQRLVDIDSESALPFAAHADGKRPIPIPQRLWFDHHARLWMVPFANTHGTGGNELLTTDIATGDVRCFLTAPTGSTVRALAISTDGRSLFVHIESATTLEGRISDQRALMMVIQRDDGGLIGN